MNKLKTPILFIKDKLKERKEQVRIQYLDLTENESQCPGCGKWNKSHQRITRWIQGIDTESNLWICLLIDVYVCEDCRKAGRHPYSYRTDASGIVQKWKRNGNKVIEKIQKGCMELGLNHHKNALRMQMDFHTSTVPGTVWKVINQNKKIEMDYREYQSKVIAEFSGQSSIDETYIGDFAIITMTDSLNERELGHLVLKGGVSQDILKPFLMELKRLGVNPKLINRDGSPLYPELLKEIWPESEQQSCHFHVTQNVTKALLNEVCQLRKKRKPPKHKRGRPNRQAQQEREFEKDEKNKLKEVFRHRFLTTKKKHTEQEKKIWDKMIEFMPELIVLRKCIIDFYNILSSFNEEDFLKKRKDWLDHEEYRKYCSDILDFLANTEKSKYLMNHLKYENAQRTSNDVERDNRKTKHRQKSHDRLRKIETLDCMKKIDALLNMKKDKQPLKLIRKVA
jgi:hypothetical protein